ncbi:MAG: response regulator transcription factor [Ruminococcaceae bacterium]|nr:response regulator transcription factor [Oscillospiraceae bacterium]
MQPSILIVDDDHDIVRAISLLLSKQGYRLYTAHNGLDALDIVATTPLHLILLDIMMPNLDGLSALMKIRATKNIPVILLSAKTEDSDKILGLSMGADDYIAKPYKPEELVARVQAQLRRYLTLGSVNTQPDNTLTVGDLVYNKDEKNLTVRGEAVHLTSTETKIVELLMSTPGRIYAAEEIYERVWNEPSYSCENTVMVHIRRIREKIELNPREPEYLKVVWGIGYKIDKK